MEDFQRVWIFFFCQYNYMTNSPLVTSSCVSTHILVDISFFVYIWMNHLDSFCSYFIWEVLYLQRQFFSWVMHLNILMLEDFSAVSRSLTQILKALCGNFCWNAFLIPCNSFCGTLQYFFYFIAIVFDCVIFKPWLTVLITIHTQQLLFFSSMSVCVSWSHIWSLLGWKPIFLTLEEA